MTRKCPKCDMTNQYTAAGYFIRQSDKRRLKRFKCQVCSHTFSQATFQKCYRQRKRKLNNLIWIDFCSNVSKRRIALKFKIDRKTVARRLIFLASLARERNDFHFKKLPLVQEMQFDDLETIEHTKCKPLSVTLAVEKKSRFILGFQVSQMPAKGLLAKIARKKYGFREDKRAIGRAHLFSKLQIKISPTATIESDENPHYKTDVQKYFPTAKHISHLGQRGSLTGQGELKKIKFDPLFSLNHTCAMLRGNVNRLIRRTWCTTKDPNRLNDHLELYVHYHNQFLLKNPT
jgi:hypothetical protein